MRKYMAIYDELRKNILEIVKEGKDPFPDILGQEEAKKQLISSLIAGRPVIIVGPPGVGKTTLAKCIAKLLPSIEIPEGVPRWAFPEFPFIADEHKRKWETGPFIKISGERRFVRVQGSADLTVEDLIGDLDPMMAFRYGPHSPKAFTPGKIFRAHKGVLFFDELNRAPPKVQNALLQVLEEKRITIGPYELEIPVDFIFIATMNPEDFAGTERLSDVLLDRFDVVYMDYPESVEIEIEIVKQKGKKFVNFPDKLLQLSITFIRKLRIDDRLEKKPSVRASIGLYEKAQTLALLRGRNCVEVKDIKDALISVLSHRIRLKPSYRIETDIKEFIKREFEKFFQSNFFSLDESTSKDMLYNKYMDKTNRPESDRCGKPSPSLGRGSGLPNSIREVDKKEVAKFLEDATNRGIFRFYPEDFYNECIKNFREAKNFYGKTIIEFLFDERVDVIERNINIPEFQRKLRENLSRRLRFLKINNVMDKNYRINEEKVFPYLLKVVEKEVLRLKAYLDSGLLEGKKLGLSVTVDNHFKAKIGRYLDIDIRKSVKEIMKKKRIYYDTFIRKRKNIQGSYELVLALDASGSMKGEKIKYAKRASIALAYWAILNSVPVGLILFNDRTVSSYSPSLDFFKLASTIASIIPRGSTNIASAVRDALRLFRGEGHLMIVTDAAPNVGKDPVKDTIKNIENLRNSGITTSVVGIDLDEECTKIAQKMANAGGGKLYLVRDYENLALVLLIDYLTYLQEH